MAVGRAFQFAQSPLACRGNAHQHRHKSLSKLTHQSLFSNERLYYFLSVGKPHQTQTADDDNLADDRKTVHQEREKTADDSCFYQIQHTHLVTFYLEFCRTQRTFSQFLTAQAKQGADGRGPHNFRTFPPRGKSGGKAGQDGELEILMFQIRTASILASAFSAQPTDADDQSGRSLRSVCQVEPVFISTHLAGRLFAFRVDRIDIQPSPRRKAPDRNKATPLTAWRAVPRYLNS